MNTVFFQVFATSGCNSINCVSHQRAEFKSFYNLIGWHGSSSRSCNRMLQELRCNCNRPHVTTYPAQEAASVVDRKSHLPLRKHRARALTGLVPNFELCSQASRSRIANEAKRSLVPRPPRPAFVACSTKSGGRPGRSRHVIRAAIDVTASWLELITQGVRPPYVPCWRQWKETEPRGITSVANTRAVSYDEFLQRESQMLCTSKCWFVPVRSYFS